MDPCVTGVYIGRFEPPHAAHLYVMLEALQHVEQLILVIGSADTRRTTKNPWTASERQQLISQMLQDEGIAPERLRYIHMPDYFYDDERWLKEVKEAVGEGQHILFGHLKDDSSSYLESFPQWTFMPTSLVSDLSATAVRKYFFEGKDYTAMVPPVVARFLNDFQQTNEAARLKEEYLALQQLDTSLLHIHTGAVLLHEGKIFLKKRDSVIGRGMFTLPEVLLDPKETLLHGALRSVDLQTAVLIRQQVFDYPKRSQRGRVISHFFQLQTNTPPHGIWLSWSEVQQQSASFFEDHREIAEYFITTPSVQHR